MKRVIIVSALCLATLLVWLGCEVVETVDCKNVSGNYAITKTITLVTATKGGNSVTVENTASVLPLQSTLTITQTGCPLLATETISALNNLVIPYAGEANSSGGLSLAISSPDALSIPLQIRILGVTETCQFKGSVTWTGQENNSALSGTILYVLTKRAEETKDFCPDAVSVQMEFTGNRH